MEYGSHKNLPHYAVVGTPTDFYVFVQTSKNNFGWSKWYKGKEAFNHYNNLRLIYKNKQKFIEKVIELYNLNS